MPLPEQQLDLTLLPGTRGLEVDLDGETGDGRVRLARLLRDMADMVEQDGSLTAQLATARHCKGHDVIADQGLPAIGPSVEAVSIAVQIQVPAEAVRT